MRKNSYKRIMMFIIALLLIYQPFTDITASAAIKLYNYNTKKNINYTGKQVIYKYNGSTINMKDTPGIIIDGIALASYQETFVKNTLKLKSKYSSAKNTLTLSKDKTTIVFTIGSKKAKVNGKAVTLSVAPVKMKYKDNGATKILVPTRFVTETFGYEYVWNSSTSTVNIIPPRNLYYNGKKVAYSGADGQVTIDGQKINLGTMESIIIKSTAMVQAKKVFSDSSIGAEYVYNKPEKKITLTKGDTVVELTLGKTTAYVNGMPQVMDTAPLIVKNLDTNKSYIMVPGSFVASYLGYDYTWNSSTKTSVITKRTVPTVTPAPNNAGSGSGAGNNTVELGSDPAPELDSVAFRWDMLSNYSEAYNRINSIVKVNEISNTTSDIACVYSIALESQDINKEVYAIRSTLPFNTSSIGITNNILSVQLNNAVVNAGEYRFGGYFVDYINSMSNADGISGKIDFYLKSTNSKYEYTLSDDKCTLYVTFYPNYITDISVGSKADKEYFMINAMEKPQVELVDYGTYIMLQIQNTVNSTGDNYCDTSFLKYIKSVQCIGTGNNSITITINKSADATYTVSQQGDTYIIGFPTADTIPTTSTSDGLQIKLPDGVSFSSVEQEDRYFDKEIAIIIPGDYRDFYNNNPVTTTLSVVNNVTVKYTGGKTELLIHTKKIQGYKLEDRNGTIGVTIGNPRDIYKNIVVLDPGHGGSAPGAIYSLNGVSYKEKDLNYSIMYKKTNKYFNAKDSKVKVYYTRIDDSDVSLDERAAFAKSVGADIFISLHLNANGKTSIRGTDVYFSSMNNDTAASGLTSKKLAGIILDNLPDQIGTEKRYVIDSKLAVCKNNTVPAVLIELLFMTNKQDLAMAVDEDFQDETAKALYDAVCKVFEAYPTGR